MTLLRRVCEIENSIHFPYPHPLKPRPPPHTSAAVSSREHGGGGGEGTSSRATFRLPTPTPHKSIYPGDFCSLSTSVNKYFTTPTGPGPGLGVARRSLLAPHITSALRGYNNESVRTGKWMVISAAGDRGNCKGEGWEYAYSQKELIRCGWRFYKFED